MYRHFRAHRSIEGSIEAANIKHKLSSNIVKNVLNTFVQVNILTSVCYIKVTILLISFKSSLKLFYVAFQEIQNFAADAAPVSATRCLAAAPLAATPVFHPNFVSPRNQQRLK